MATKKNNGYAGEGYEEYLKKFGHYSVLTRQEERDLFTRYHNGDLKAKELLVKHNLKLVVSYAWKSYCNNVTLPIDDLIQDGFFGLNRAIEKFDLARNTKFSTYAVPWIRQAVGKGILNKTDMIRVPLSRTQNMNEYKSLASEAGRELTPEEVVRLLNVRLEVADALIQANRNVVSLDAPPKGEMETTLAELIPGDSTVESVIEKKMQEEYLNSLLCELLPPKYYDVVKRRYGIDCEQETYDAIALDYKVSRNRICEMCKEALKRIREALEESPSI